jgi:hypothetical protein
MAEQALCEMLATAQATAAKKYPAGAPKEKQRKKWGFWIAALCSLLPHSSVGWGEWISSFQAI